LFEALHGDVPYKVRLAVRDWRVVGAGDSVGGDRDAFATDEAEAGEVSRVRRPRPTLRVSMDLRVPSRAIAGMLLGREGGAISSIARTAKETMQGMLNAGGGVYPALAPYEGASLSLDLHVSVKDGAGAQDRAARTRHADGSVGQAASLE
jgi:hypothetical protein